MQEIAIVAAARTPTGRFGGLLSGLRADHLGGAVLTALAERTDLRPDAFEDVIFGCVTQIGEQSGNIARTSALSAGWPESVPGLTIDRKCGSGEVAVHMAAGQIAAGVREVMIAGGAESMSRVPMGSNRALHGDIFGPLLLDRFEMVSQGEAAERIADKWGLTRGDLDDYAFQSHSRAAAAAAAGHFVRETIPIAPDRWRSDKEVTGIVASDQTIRPTTRDVLSTLRTSFRPEGGKATAGNSSQISDGAAGVVLMSRKRAKALGLKPMAVIRAMTTVGSDPTLMLTGPLAATRKALDQAGLALSDIDLFEVNEAFAAVPLMWMREFGVGAERLNVNGGAIALGHPLGASGARLMVTLLHEMERRGARYGLQSMCCAGGLGTATIVERVV